MSHALSSQLPLNQGCEKLAGDLFFWQSHENSLVDRLGPGNKRHKNWDMDRIRTPYGTWYCMVQWCSHQDCPFNPRHFNDALGCESKVVSNTSIWQWHLGVLSINSNWAANMGQMKWCWSGWRCLPWLPITHTRPSKPHLISQPTRKQYHAIRAKLVTFGMLQSNWCPGRCGKKRPRPLRPPITCTDSKAFVPQHIYHQEYKEMSTPAYHSGILNASGCFVIHHLIKRTQIKSCETVRPGTLPIEENWQSSTYPPNNLSKCALSLRACTPRLGNSHPRLSIWFIKVIWSAWPSRTAHPQN